MIGNDAYYPSLTVRGADPPFFKQKQNGILSL
jgi:hypothetical protein